jgi:hypothetical protein
LHTSPRQGIDQALLPGIAYGFRHTTTREKQGRIRHKNHSHFMNIRYCNKLPQRKQENHMARKYIKKQQFFAGAHATG